MHVGEKISVTYQTVDQRNHPTIKTVTGRCVWVHPQGLFATVQLPSGYKVTVYPQRRVGSDYEKTRQVSGPKR